MYLAVNLSEVNFMGAQIPSRDYFVENIEAQLNKLYGAGYRLTKNRSDAEDLVAETVTKAWANIHGLLDTQRFLPWLLRIMTNTFISEKRKVANRTFHESYTEEPAEDEKPFSLFDRLHQPFLLWWGNPEQEFLNGLLHEDIETAMQSLPENFRIVVMLADVEGLTYQEIADAIEVPVGTVRSRLARGRSILQKVLWKHAQDRGLVSGTDEDQNCE